MSIRKGDLAPEDATEQGSFLFKHQDNGQPLQRIQENIKGLGSHMKNNACNSHELYLKLNDEYWKGSDINDVADACYYDRCEKIVRDIAGEYLNDDMDVIDMGCANGRYTAVLSEYCDHCYGYDYSRNMLKQAEKLNNRPNVVFDYSDIRERQHDFPPSQAIFCMGLFTVIHDEDAISGTLSDFASSLKRGGGRLLVTRESLSLGRAFQWYTQGKHYGIYRSQDEYVRLFTDAGFSLTREINNLKLSQSVNSFYIWELRS